MTQKGDKRNACRIVVKKSVGMNPSACPRSRAFPAHIVRSYPEVTSLSGSEAGT